jgi:small subunit ribosomal protein S21
MGIRVLVNPGEPVDSALRRFKKEVVKSGVLMELKRRQFFESNTEKRLRRAELRKQRARQASQRNR